MSRTCEVVNECQAGLIDGHEWCNGACHDVMYSENHCGSCNYRCAGNALCQSGDCECVNNNQTHCNSPRQCVTLATDEANCGDCGNQCPAGATCTGGECACPTGQVDCFGECIALGTISNCTAWKILDVDASCPRTLHGPGTRDCVLRPRRKQLDDESMRRCDTTDIDRGGRASPAHAMPAELPDMCGNACVDFDTSEEACGDCDTGCNSICNRGSCSFVQEIALGRGFGCMLFTDGLVGCFGSNDSGRLGRGLSTALTSEPLGLLTLTNIVDIDTRDGHACALDSTGQLWCWGENSAQQVGNGNTTDQVSPVMVRTGVASVATVSFTRGRAQDTGRVESPARMRPAARRRERSGLARGPVRPTSDSSALLVAVTCAP